MLEKRLPLLISTAVMATPVDMIWYRKIGLILLDTFFLNKEKLMFTSYIVAYFHRSKASPC